MSRQTWVLIAQMNRHDFVPHVWTSLRRSAMGPGYESTQETAGYPVYEPIGYIDQAGNAPDWCDICWLKSMGF